MRTVRSVRAARPGRRTGGFEGVVRGKQTAAVGLLALLWVMPGGAQDAGVDPIRVYVFAAEEATDEDAQVAVHLPPRHPVPRDPDPYYFEADQGRQAAEALRRRLERKEVAEVVMVVPSRNQADVYLEVVATSRGSSAPWQPRNDGVMVIRVSIRNHHYTTDFIGIHRGILRPPVVGVAGQLTRWIESNYPTLQRLIYGLP